MSVHQARAAVASPHWRASEVGAEILAAGGSAIDATVATNAMLTVAYPHMCGLGGDLFLLYYEARSGRVHCLNGSGPAPRLASRAAFRDRGLERVPERGALSVTVPGTVAAWDVALRRFGAFSLPQLLAPAVEAAEQGVEVTDRLGRWIAGAANDLAVDPVLRRRFLDTDGAPLRGGAMLRQPELAGTLRRLSDRGARDFYRGEIAEEIDRSIRAAGGLLRRDDLERYEPESVAPLRLRYRGLDVLTTPPNSQGIASLLMLNALTELGAGALAVGTADHLDALVTAKRAAFAARDRCIADPRFALVEPDTMLRRAWIRSELAGSDALVGDRPVGGDTVYICVVDDRGNACSAIQSIFYGFGSCFVAGDTGVLLHNRGHSFSLADDDPNRLEPGKRPRHTLMASLALERGRPRFVFGSMGADGQPQFNVQVLERLLTGAGPGAALSAPRILHGRFVLEDDPEVLHVERAFGEDVIAELARRGHRLEVAPALDERMGHAHAIAVADDGSLTAASDPRSDGAAVCA